MKARRHRPFTARLLPGLLLFLVVLVVAVRATVAEPSAASLYVSPSGSDRGGANTCADAAAPCATLRHALGRSAPGDTLRPAPGTYSEAGLIIPHALTLTGDGAAVTLDGGGKSTVFIVAPSASATVEGLTIRNGLGGRGGAIRVEAAGSLTLRRVALEGNRADSGGAVYMESGIITIEDSRLIGNTAAMGGAVYVEGGALALVQSEVSGNSAELGGGLALGPGATATLNRATLSGNTAARFGGAIHNTGTMTLANSLLLNNKAGATGGGLFSDGGLVTADYTTWIDNDGPAGTSIAGRGQTRLNYSVLTGGNTCDNSITGNGNLIEDVDCGLPIQPAAGLLPDGRPDFGGNAIDSGASGACLSTNGAALAEDLRGEPRPADGDRDGAARCDIGAFEFQPRLTVIHNPTLPDNAGFDFGGDFGSFTLQATGRSRRIFEASPGSYRLEQAREPGWKLNAVTCDGDADGGSLIDTAAGSATIDLDPAESIVCAFNTRPNRETIGVTLIAPTAGDVPVAFDGGLGAFELRATQPDMRSGRLALGVYPIQATPPAGWRVAAVICAGDRDGGTTIDLPAATALVDLDARETIGCAFTLAPIAPATLTVRQETAPTGDASFAYTGDLGLFALRAPSAAAQTFALAPGVYRVHELLHPLWALGRLDCAGDTDGGSVLLPQEATAVVDLDAGEAVTCVFSHARATSGTGTITIVQASDPPDGTPFPYSGLLGEFALSSPSAASRVWAELRPGSYSVRQALSVGWALDTITCAGDADGGGSVLLDEATALIDLDEGEAIVCAFGNSRPSTTGAIIIIHEANPADDTQFRYTGALGGFNLRAPSRPSRSFLDLAPGVYTVGVRPLDGWTLVAITCEGDSDDGSVIDPVGRAVTIDLDAAELVICRFRHLGLGVEPTPTPTPTIGWQLYLPVVRR